MNRRNARVLPQLRAVLRCPGHESNHRAVGIDEAVACAKTSAYDVIAAQERKHGADLVAGDDARVFKSQSNLPLVIPAQVGHMLFASRTEEISLRPVSCGMSQALVETAIERNRVQRHLDVHGG